MLEIFDIDLISLGGGIYRYHGNNTIDIQFAGNIYTPAPIECDGFEATSKGLPTPKVVISNVLGAIGGFLRDWDGLQGAKVTRTKLKQPAAGTYQFTQSDVLGIPDIYTIDRATNHTRLSVTLELRSIFDLGNRKVPRRSILQSACPYVYKSAECGYTGTLPTCDRNISACLAHFRSFVGDNPTLNFGGFPNVDRFN